MACDEGAAASPDLFISMLRQCGDRVNVIAIGGSGLSLPDASLTREFARLLRNETPTNVLHLVASGNEAGATPSGQLQYQLANVLRKSAGKITFVLLSGGGNDLAGESALDPLLLGTGSGKEPQDYVDKERLERTLQRIERAFRAILNARDALSPNTVVVSPAHGNAGAFGPHIRGVLGEKEIPAEHRDAVLELLSQRFGEVIVRATSEEPAHRRRVIVVPTEDRVTGDDGSAEMHPAAADNAQVARRIFATVAAECQGLFGSAGGAAGARHCELQP